MVHPGMFVAKKNEDQTQRIRAKLEQDKELRAYA